MAEYVEQRMEEMLGEVEQMERVNLLEPKEVKELLKKRKHFEYKIQKQTKLKEDYLAYIQYETNLLSLLALRRENIGYQHKKAEIEGGIKVRINKLFKIMEHRFQSDVAVWLSHIKFLEEAHWESSVSKIYLRMLQVHSSKPGLWVAAAKWEFNNLGNADNGRKIMLRGLRFLPKSWAMHREYLKLELLYVEQLKKRAEVLGNGADAGSGDSVTDCAIVRLVALNGLQAINSPQFAVSLLSTLRTFSFALSLEEEVVQWLEEKFPTSPVTVDTQARRNLASGKEGLTQCIETYMQALTNNSKDKQLFHLAFTTFKELLDWAPKLANKIMKAMLSLLKLGEEHSLLRESHYQWWLSCLSYESVPDTLVAVAEAAVAHYPQSGALWVERLAVAALRGDHVAVLAQGLTALKGLEGPTVRLWEAALGLMDPEKGWQLVRGPLLDTNSAGLRLLLLRQAGYRGIQAARDVYQTYRLLPPFSLGLHYLAASLEQEESPPSLSHLRLVLDTACDQVGHTEVGPWLARIKLEIAAGKPLEAANIVCRAEASLKDKELVGKFTLLREKEGV